MVIFFNASPLGIDFKDFNVVSVTATLSF